MIRSAGILFLILVLSVDFITAQAGNPPSGEEFNLVDDLGMKTGYWKITGAMRKTEGYAPYDLIEEGRYIANKKTGLWKKYYSGGTLLSEIEYVKNIPNGNYTTYYPTGKIEEKGHWTNSRNTGKFKRYHPNGQVSQDFTFSDNGRRSGVQRYYHENGQIELEVEIVNGQEQGVMKRYYANGDLKETKTFNDGKVDKESIVKHSPKKPEVVVKETPAVVEKVTETVKTDKPNLSVFKATGNNALYNKDRQVSQVGYFKNGKLYNGKWYRYDENGLLTAIEIYKKGKFIGNAVIDDMN